MRRTALGTLAALLMALSATSPALADSAPPPVPPPSPPPAPPAPPPPAPAPAPKKGKLTLEVTNGVPARGRKYVLTGSSISIIGRVKPYVRGQRVRVRISSGHHRPIVIRKKVGRSSGAGIFHIR